MWNKSFNSEKNSTNSDSIKRYASWMSRFEFQNKFCNLSLVLRDRLHLALFKKIWWHNSCHTVKHHSYFDEIRATSWSRQNLVEIAMILYHVARVMSPDFLKDCQFQPPKTNEKLQNLFWNSNLLIQQVWLLVELGLAAFFGY